MASDDFPKLLLISELSLAKSQQGKSSNPTLYNLFKDYPASSLLQLIPETTQKLSPPTAPHTNSISYTDNFLPILRNRIGLVVNKWFSLLNSSILSLSHLPNTRKLKVFSPEIILICPITLSGMIMGCKVAKALDTPFLVYFMDDWIAVDQSGWLGGDTQSLAYYLLKESAGWIMISDYLREELSNRYFIEKELCLVAHNPAKKYVPNLPLSESAKKAFRISYAGSIQVMHLDAFLAVSEAVCQLRKEGEKIELILYTTPFFWKAYKEKFLELEIIYGSLIPYDQLFQTLYPSDLLLVCTSFQQGNQHAVRSSLLTKLTDYMAVGKPIISCGPEYSACNKFLEKWNCGIICATESIDEIKYLLRKCMTETEVLSDMAKRASTVLEENFSEKILTEKLYQFIKQTSLNAKH